MAHDPTLERLRGAIDRRRGRDQFVVTDAAAPRNTDADVTEMLEPSETITSARKAGLVIAVIVMAALIGFAFA